MTFVSSNSRPTPIKKLPEGQPKVVQSTVPGAGQDLSEIIPRPSSVGSGFQPKGKLITLNLFLFVGASVYGLSKIKFAGLLGHYFVRKWFVTLQCKTIHYFFCCSLLR